MDNHHGTAAAARFWANPNVRQALDDAIATTQHDHDLEHPTAEAVVLDAISQHAHAHCADAVAHAREAGITWKTLADAFARSISGVRHRYDPRTIEQHRESERRRRSRMRST